MELPTKILEQIAFITKPKNGEHVLVVMDKFTHEEHLSQPLQTSNKQLKKAVLIFTGYFGIFNVTDKKISFFSKNQLTMTILMLIPFRRAPTYSRD